MQRFATFGDGFAGALAGAPAASRASMEENAMLPMEAFRP
jgi:hypothetical protein